MLALSGGAGLLVQGALGPAGAFLALLQTRPLRLAALKAERVSALSGAAPYLCRFGRLRPVRVAGAAAANGGEERVPAPAEALVGCGSAEETEVQERAVRPSAGSPSGGSASAASPSAGTYSRVPRMTSAMEPT